MTGLRIHRRLLAAALPLVALLAPAGSSAQFLDVGLIEEQSLLPSPDTGGAVYGADVDTDGNLVVVGAPEVDSSSEEDRAFIWERSGTTWSLLQVLDGDPSTLSFADGVAVDGDVVVVQGLGGSDAPVARVYRRSGDTFVETQTLPRPGGGSGSIALRGDTLVIGRVGDSSADVYGFDSSGVCGTGGTCDQGTVGEACTQDSDCNGFVLRQTLSGAVGFGCDVATDGSRIVVGVQTRCQFGAPSGGEVRVYARSGDTWSQETVLTRAVAAADEAFGRTVAVDGDTVVAGACCGNRTFTASAYVFESQAGIWTEKARLLPSSPPTNVDRFGAGVAVDGGLVLVGAGAFSGGSTPGAHLFERTTGGSWMEQRKLEASQTKVQLGARVAMRNGAIVLGSDDCCPEGPGKPAPVFGEDLSDASRVAAALRPLLFRPEALDAGKSGDEAAFRFQDLLFRTDTAAAKVRSALEEMASLYGPAEVDRSLEVEAKLRQALGVNPAAPELQDLLLDIFYNRTAAARILATAGLDSADRARLDLPPPTPPDRVIDLEIGAVEGVLDRYRLALGGGIPEVATAPGGYVDLLQDDTGRALFQTRVPVRGLEAATEDGVPVIDCDGNGVRDPNDLGDPGCTLFAGYKDLVLLIGLLRDTGRTAVDLAGLYLMRGTPVDLDRARSLIGETQTLLFTQGNLYLGFFPLLPGPDDDSALSEAIAGWRQAMADLSTAEPLAVGSANALGFDEDFLIFMQKRDEFVDLFDSYDIFEAFLDPLGSSNPLATATTELGGAQASFEAFRGFEDQLAIQFASLSGPGSPARNRLREIVGVFPGEPGFDTPELNVGSEIWQQLRSIEAAQLAIDRAQQEIENLNRRVQIEIQRRAEEARINGLIQQTIIDYGERQASLTEEIGHIRAAMAATNELVDLFAIENLTTGRAFLGAVNVGMSAGGEEGIAQLEAEKERLAALEKAEIRDLEDQILAANSKAQIKTWLLDMNTLLIESQQAALLMRQEVARLKALFDEKAALEATIEEASEALTRRFFADPLHRLRFEVGELRATLAFEEAQRWIYFMIRALEYKWNTPFSQDFLGQTWKLDSVFSARNARELGDLYDAMVQFNQIRESTAFEPGVLDRISLREDVLGFRLVDEGGLPILYEDPLSGAPVGAIPAFRSFLRSVEDPGGNPRVRFSTAREFPGTSLFLGPIFFPDGSVDSPGTTLDKIEWVVVRLPGSHGSGATTVRGDLEYGGTSFIRRTRVGQADPLRPDRLRNELTAYTTRFWFQDLGSGEFQSTEALVAPVQMRLGGLPPSDAECGAPGGGRIEVFQERSVAASAWELVLRPQQGGVQVLDLDELDDIEFYVCHRWVLRAP